MMEQAPPEPTAEELAAKEEAAKAAAAAAAKKGAKGGVPATEVVEEKVEPILVESPPNFLDSVFKDEELGTTVGPCSTLTLKNGLIVRHMPNGDVV